MNKITELKVRLFPKGIKRSLKTYHNRLFNRTSEKKMVAGFNKLNIEPGSVICIHAMVSGMGYIPGGLVRILESVFEAVPNSTILMPTFPFSGSTEEYLAGNPIYDKHNTPSKSGLLSEVLRTYPGTKRSFHPTHPCAALGPDADLLINKSEESKTPFGSDSSYGRFCSLDNAVLLLIHTNSSSIVHRVQEIVNMPNLFYNNLFTARGIDQARNIRDYQIHVHTPEIPLYWIIPGDEKKIEYIWSPDYCFLFPEYNRIRILNRLQNSKAKTFLSDRHRYFLDTGIYTLTRINGAEILAVKAKPWLERICRDLKTSLAEFSEYYSLVNMKNTSAKGFLSKD
jgi:aminoglycoside N3'-acetyltransferase